MKINKQVQKDCISRIKDIAAKEGYKKIQNTIYKIEHENIIFVNFLIVNSECLVYRINIKKRTFDEIFWKIMGMEENIKKGDTLRVNGAFSAPSILIAKGSIELSENINIVADIFWGKVSEEISNFLEKNDVIQYILSDNKLTDANILKCLSYMHLNLLSDAKKLAEDQMLLGDKGRFENMGKGFFELVLSYIMAKE